MTAPIDGTPRDGHAGSGTGPITPDGCAVDLWDRLPPGAEPDIIGAAVPPGASILELGCGAGRMTRPLLARGFTLTAVDESAQMLERVGGARTVRSSIEDLHLDEVFDVVMLGSFLVHAADAEQRQALLRTSRRHVSDDGCVLIQREGEGWHDELPKQSPAGDGVVRVLSSQQVRPGVRSVHTEYVFPDARWTQTFLSRPLSAEQFEAALDDADLQVDAYLTTDGTWVRAIPLPG